MELVNINILHLIFLIACKSYKANFSMIKGVKQICLICIILATFNSNLVKDYSYFNKNIGVNSQLIKNTRTSFSKRNTLDDLEEEIIFDKRKLQIQDIVSDNQSEKEKLGVKSFYNKYDYSNNQFEIKANSDSENFPNENLSFIQTKAKSKSKSSSRVKNKQLIEPIEDLKNSGVPFDLENLDSQVKDPDVNVYGLADPEAKLTATEKDIAYKVQVMLNLQNKVFRAAKPERFEGEYSYERTKMQKENGDDFVGFLGFLGESAKKYTT